ncbi:hypothetical protein [Thermococcus henrietii]|uniref:hypothetical protein n=1 Tax=Thermococcus henrietii TaxID=2016361 RepID=UPI000C0800AB|nr:hypothetical protein [Thermococcus henrietii]
MTWNVGLFYYTGSGTTPTSQIKDFVREFDGAIILGPETERDSADIDRLIEVINRFWDLKPGFQLIAEIPNPHGT